MRSNMASWRIDRTDGIQPLSAAPLPHAERTARPSSCRRAICSRRRRVVLTQLGQERAPAARPGRDRCRPTRRSRCTGTCREDQRPRSLRSCCREDDGGRAALAHTEDGGLSEADGVHDGLDLGRSIIQRANFRDRVRQPDPGLVEQKDATERGELLEEGLEFGQGPEQLDVAGERPDEDELDRPVAEHLIRQAEIAAGCVRRFRHGIERTAVKQLRLAARFRSCRRSTTELAPSCGHFHLVITQATVMPGMTSGPTRPVTAYGNAVNFEVVARTLHELASVLVRWCPRQDSNLRPSAPEADALSPELRGRM